MDNTELLPCPLCGGKADIYYGGRTEGLGLPHYGVECRKCYTNTTAGNLGKDQAAKQWNRRTDPYRDALRALVDVVRTHDKDCSFECNPIGDEALAAAEKLLGEMAESGVRGEG